MILILGGSGSGKSAYAEERIKYICSEKQLPMYYIATMKVYGKEEEKIVERHRQLRAGKGFITIEQPTDVRSCLGKMKAPAGALLECTSNLTANEMFREEEPVDEDLVVSRICSQMKELSESLSQFVVVSNNIFEDGIEYDEITLAYIRALGRINTFLAKEADEVWESVAGIPVKIK